MPDPYDIDIDVFEIRPTRVVDGKEVFHIILDGHKAIDAIVFRGHLVNFLFEYAKDDWYLGNDGQYIRFSLDDLCLALSPQDADRLRQYGWLK